MVKFEELPKEVRDRVHFQNDTVDDICSVLAEAEKADFVLRQLQEVTDYRTDLDDSDFVWCLNKKRISKLVEILGDYTYKVTEMLKEAKDKIQKNTDELKESLGGELEDGSAV